MKRLSLLVLILALATGSARAQTPEPSPSPKGPYVPRVQPVAVPEPVVLPPPTEAPPPETAEPITADEAARIALAYQSEVAVARAGVEAAQGRVVQARAGLNPQLNVNSSYSQNLLNNPAGGTGGRTGAGLGVGFNVGGANSYQVGAAVQQLLFDFGNTRATARQAEALRRAAGANLSRVQADLVFDVKDAFYQWVQAERLVEVALANVANQQEHLSVARGRFEAGIGLPADVTRTETAVAAAITNLTQARNRAVTTRVNLALLMGIDPRTPLVPDAASAEPELDTSDPQRLFDLALQIRPEMAQAEANIEAGGYSLDAARTTSDPTLTASLNYNRQGQSSFTFDSLMLTLGVQWQAVDGGLEAGRVQEAQANLDSAVAQRLGVRERVRAEVARAWMTLESARQALVSARAQEENARETVRLASGRYRAGLGILLDVLDAQQALVTAETDRVNAETALHLAQAGLNYAVGQPLAEQ